VDSDSWTYHTSLLALMLAFSLAYVGLVRVQRGPEDAKAWGLAWILECALSVDNLFVFNAVCKAYEVRKDDLRWVVTVGFYGAILLRAPLILFLVELFKLKFAVNVTMGAFLIIMGILALDDDPHENVVHFGSVRFLKWSCGSRFREAESTDNPEDAAHVCLVDDETGQWQFGRLLMVITMIAVVDLVFSVDSIGCKAWQVQNRYINLSSSLMAMFSLRALFFILRKFDEGFALVKYGTCAILAFVGTKMIMSKWVVVPLGVMVGIIIGIFMASLVASWIKVLVCGASCSGIEACTEVESRRSTSTVTETSSSRLDSTGGGVDLAGDQDCRLHEKASGADVTRRTGPTDKEDLWSVLDRPHPSARKSGGAIAEDMPNAGCALL
jgi:tellurite resistance protein TerC